ncbi:MAG: hydrolase [Polyangiales bacterium]
MSFRVPTAAPNATTKKSAHPLAALIFDIDGVLLDVRPSYYRIIEEVAGATLEDIARFKDHGGFNDDWELARAAYAWIKSGRPAVFSPAVQTYRDVVTLCGHDPGDLSAHCDKLYRSGYWRDEIPMVSPSLLHALAARYAVRACTGRNRWELARAEELLGFDFPLATTSDDVKKPHPDAVLRLITEGTTHAIVVGDSADDRRTVEAARGASKVCFHYQHVSHHHLDSEPYHLLLPYLQSLLETTT